MLREYKLSSTASKAGFPGKKRATNSSRWYSVFNTSVAGAVVAFFQGPQSWVVQTAPAISQRVQSDMPTLKKLESTPGLPLSGPWCH